MAKESFIKREMGLFVTEIFESRKNASVLMFGGLLLVGAGVLLVGTTLAIGFGAGVIVGAVGGTSIAVGLVSFALQTLDRFIYGN